MKELEAIKARAEAAERGPWAVMNVNDPGEGVNFIDVYAETDGLETVCRMPNPADFSTREQLEADAEFIAHAPTDVAKLIAALEAVEAVASTAPEQPGLGGPHSLVSAEAIRQAITEALQ